MVCSDDNRIMGSHLNSQKKMLGGNKIIHPPALLPPAGLEIAPGTGFGPGSGRGQVDDAGAGGGGR